MSPEGPRAVAVVLAAGAGTRFAGPAHKLLTELDGVPIVRRAVDAPVAAGLRVVVVTGAVDCSEALADHVEHGTVRLVHNEGWADGQASSAQRAIAVADELGADAVIVGLGDQPFLDPTAWRALADVDAELAIATYDGRRGHPVRLGRAVWPELPTVGEDVGRTLLADRSAEVREIVCSGSPIDIDTTEELSRWS